MLTETQQTETDHSTCLECRWNVGDSILQVGAVKIDFNRARYILLARLLALTMVNIGMEDSCVRNMHQFRRGSLEREVCRSSRGDLKGIRHLIWFTRLIIVILLLMCSVLVMLVYTLRYSVSNQHLLPQDNHMGGSTQKHQQINANSNALLTASKRRPANSNEPIEWEYSSGNAHLGTFTSNGTDLIVPRDGTYRIYLQITYTRPEKVMAPPNVDSLEVTLLIFKMAYKTDEALLQCYDKVDLNSLFRKSLYTAATFDLKFNDRLKVKTTNPELMVLSECTTFFGADLIS
ncbi:tumor necrosis factor ligand superfamily member 10 [Hypomesus transpacificus]|uniref:tumor necrosis factor ligand superfamily member 10 n=1 Tax=Hypomesus transpacificus TaxID=137520 RepID=UPI001F0799D2|nr:tumor necrosis factor ligand superfamily member 10 [Hypomesus transpacificus]